MNLKRFSQSAVQRGFSIVTAIFLLVVLAGLGVGMLTFSAAQHQSSAMDVLGSRAYQASRAGIEWGAYQVLQASNAAYATACRAGATNNVMGAGSLAGTLGGFSVTVGCTASAHSDVSATTGTVWVYQLNSVATQGAAGGTDYVERQTQASIAQ